MNSIARAMSTSDLPCSRSVCSAPYRSWSGGEMPGPELAMANGRSGRATPPAESPRRPDCGPRGRRCRRQSVAALAGDRSPAPLGWPGRTARRGANCRMIRRRRVCRTSTPPGRGSGMPGGSVGRNRRSPVGSAGALQHQHRRNRCGRRWRVSVPASVSAGVLDAELNSGHRHSRIVSARTRAIARCV